MKTTYSCKECKTSKDVPADLMGSPTCPKCRKSMKEGPLPSTMRTLSFPHKQAVIVEIDDKHGVTVKVNDNETVVTIFDGDAETEHTFPHKK